MLGGYLLFASIRPSLLSGRSRQHRIPVLSSPNQPFGLEVGIHLGLLHFICSPNLGGKLYVLHPIGYLSLLSYRSLSMFLYIFNIRCGIFCISELLGLFVTSIFKSHFDILM